MYQYKAMCVLRIMYVCTHVAHTTHYHYHMYVHPLFPLPHTFPLQGVLQLQDLSHCILYVPSLTPSTHILVVRCATALQLQSSTCVLCTVHRVEIIFFENLC